MHMLDSDAIRDLLGVHKTQLTRWGLSPRKVEVYNARGSVRRNLYGVEELAEKIAALDPLPAGIVREARFYASTVGLAEWTPEGEPGPLQTKTAAEGRAYVLGWLAGVVAVVSFLEQNGRTRARLVENADAG